jgi:hypothetical protein
MRVLAIIGNNKIAIISNLIIKQKENKKENKNQKKGEY